MADNVSFQTKRAVTPAQGTIVGADSISGVAYQRIKLIHGADGTNAGDVSTANPVPNREYRPPYSLAYYDGSGNIEYLCTNATHGTATTATDWSVTKFFWDGSGNFTGSQELPGSVTGRAALGWV